MKLSQIRIVVDRVVAYKLRIHLIRVRRKAREKGSMFCGFCHLPCESIETDLSFRKYGSHCCEYELITWEQAVQRKWNKRMLKRMGERKI